MKKRISLLAALSLTFFSAKAQTTDSNYSKWSFNAGYSQYNFDRESTNLVNYKNSSGFYLGADYNFYSFGNFKLNTGLRFTSFNFENNFGNGADESFKGRFGNIPLNVTSTLPLGENGELFFGSGFNLSLHLNNEISFYSKYDDVSLWTKPYSLQSQFLLGYNLNTDHGKFGVELFYQLPLDDSYMILEQVNNRYKNIPSGVLGLQSLNVGLKFTPKNK